MIRSERQLSQTCFLRRPVHEAAAVIPALMVTAIEDCHARTKHPDECSLRSTQFTYQLATNFIFQAKQLFRANNRMD